jgi:predicted ATP-dependent protease
MAGIEDFIEIFRGENLKFRPKKNKGITGRFVTDNLKYAEAVGNKFPAIIKSAKIPKERFLKSMEAFDQSGQPTTNRTSRSNLGLLDKADKGKLKIDILRTLGLNIKNLTPLAMKGLNILASLPSATIGMVLQTTPANADEANMQLEDFAKLNEGSTNVDKALSSRSKDM